MWGLFIGMLSSIIQAEYNCWKNQQLYDATDRKFALLIKNSRVMNRT
jgi:hypothetical protein